MPRRTITGPAHELNWDNCPPRERTWKPLSACKTIARPAAYWSGLSQASFATAKRMAKGDAPKPPAMLSPIRFRNVAGQAGLDFVVANHPTADKHLVETMAGGVAAFDYDNDGLTDIFFANGAETPSLVKTSAKYHNRLFRNVGNMEFRDVTAAAGLQGTGYSMGAAAGDFDNDGYVDLFVPGAFGNLLYRNLGNGRFEETTASAGVKSDRWSVAAGWFDYDNDGFLDLFVVDYLQWSPENNLYCGDNAKKLRTYCHPKYYEGQPNTLYRNKKDGTFEDVSEASGIASHVGKGMSVVFADYDQDGHADVFITNDTEPNFLFRNRETACSRKWLWRLAPRSPTMADPFPPWGWISGTTITTRFPTSSSLRSLARHSRSFATRGEVSSGTPPTARRWAASAWGSLVGASGWSTSTTTVGKTSSRRTLMSPTTSKNSQASNTAKKMPFGQTRATALSKICRPDQAKPFKYAARTAAAPSRISTTTAALTLLSHRSETR